MGFIQRAFPLPNFLTFFEGHNDVVNKNDPIIVELYVSV